MNVLTEDEQKKINRFVFANYAELSRKDCVTWIISLAFLDLLFLIKERMFYTALSVGMSAALVIWFLFLCFSKRRKLPQSRFLCDGLAGMYMAVLFNVKACRLLFGEGRGIALAGSLLLMLGCGVLLALYARKGFMEQNVSDRKKSTAAFAAGGAALGVAAARLILPKLEYSLAMTIGVGILLLCSLLLSAFSVQLLRAMYVFKYKLTAPRETEEQK